MKAKRLWTIQSFLSCFFWNGVMIAFFFIISAQMLQGYQLWVNALMASPDAVIAENLNTAFLELKRLLNLTEQYLAPVIIGSGALFTFILWLFILFQGRRLAGRVAFQTLADQEKSRTEPLAAKGKKAREEKVVPGPAVEEVSTPQAAVQVLSILQREGRLIDFLQEDLSVYDDAQIGAAVRSIHEGCKQGLADHMQLKPILEEEEGSEVTIPANFDPNTIRLTGNVKGDPPFTGQLRHRGWQTTKVDLPATPRKDKDRWIIVPAEVEIVG